MKLVAAKLRDTRLRDTSCQGARFSVCGAGDVVVHRARRGLAVLLQAFKERLKEVRLSDRK